ncbi:MAG: PilC/PilY family type IV pilus protein [Gammaproteobacteria bacterium]|nr:PilC/PilY family type IV pilus protein [Gammaproteobacteria bacterium]
MNSKERITHCKRPGLHVLAFAGLTLLVGAVASYAAPPPTALSDTPLIVVAPTHPQVLLLLGNSQSMDGTLSGAIMTGAAGTYTVPAGFTPPVDGSNNYTVSGKDNSASRLNVAKAAIKETLKSYDGNTDFGLMTLGTGSRGLYTTWAYYMSQAGGFTFTNTAGGNTYPNPCYGVTSADCTALAGRYGSGVKTQLYFVAQGPSDGSSSTPGSADDPKVNDVLYANGLKSVFVSYNGPTPATPYPPNFSLANYNSGSILISYANTTPSIGGFATGPTNAGYVPYSKEVLYAKRGFGYYAVPNNASKLLVPIAVTTASRQTTFTNLLAPETNSNASTEIKSDAVNAAIAGLLKNAHDYYINTPPPSNTGCTPNKYAVLITDGLPTWDLAGKAWPPLGSAAAVGYGVTATIDGTGTLTATNSTAVNDTLTWLANLKSQKILTYVVGFGAGVDPTVNPAAAATLRAMAVAGGTDDYFPATTPAAVAAQLKVILEAILAANVSTTTAAVNAVNLTTASKVYQASFISQDTPYNDWTGNVKAFAIAADGTIDPSTPVWSAQALLDAKNWDTQRNIITYKPSNKKGIPFRWPAIPASPGASELDASQSTALGSVDVLNYLRGNTAKEKHNGGTLRDRSHKLGDIADGSPLYVAEASGPYTDVSYQAFQATAKTRTPMLYVGANDGMLHAFNATDGQEVFAFIPSAVFSNLSSLSLPGYNSAHKFYVDGPPVAGDVQFADGSWHTLLTGGLNNGGNSIYGLDVTTPPTDETSAASKVLWEYTDTDLGKTYSHPTIAKLATSTGSQFAVIFGSGYNNSDGKPYLYVVKAEDGSLIQKLDLCSAAPSACDGTKANGLSSPAVVSPNGSGLVTLTYVGDLQGNLWKVDLSSASPASWSASLVFKAKDGSGSAQPITTVPTVSLHPNAPQKPGYLVLFGTGRFVGTPDITDTSQQSFYGIWDNLSARLPTRSNLVAQVLTGSTTAFTIAVTGNNKVRTNTQNPVDWSTQRGWYIDLDSGERTVTDSRLVNKRAIFTSFVPSSSSCTGGGQSWLTITDYATGGAFTDAEIDLDNDGKLDATDKIGANSPVSISLGQNYAAAPSIIEFRDPAHPDIRGKGLPGLSDPSKLPTPGTRNTSPQDRVSWTQIQ